MNPPVFIVGCPRSGTSFLYHLLLSSGGFAEFHTQMNVFDVLEPIFGDLRIPQNKKKMMREWLRSKAFAASRLDASDLEAKVMAECNSGSDFLRIVMDEVARKQGVDRWIDSTPTNIPHMMRISRDFPDAQFIHVIRDARDVALSLDQLHWSRPLPWDRKRSLLAAGIYWEWIVRKGRKFGAMLGAKYIEVRYEELVEQPQPSLKKIGDFLGHDLDYARIQQVGIGSVRKPLTAFQQELREGHFTPVGRWRNKFPAHQLEWFERLVGRNLEDLGYELSHPGNHLQRGRPDSALRVQDFLQRQTMGEGEHSFIAMDGQLLGHPNRQIKNISP
ncbi:MAG: sulfotransferase [Terriglobales bacterium]